MYALRTIITKWSNPHFELLALLVLSISVVLTVFLRIAPAEYYPAWDQAHHLSVALGYYHALSRVDARDFWFMLTNSDTIYPPFFHLLVTFGYLLFGLREKIGPLVNYPFVILLVFSTYQLAILAIPRHAGFLAAALTLFVPLYLDLWTDAMTDMTSVALFVTLYWTVLKTNYFSSTRWSILSGVTALCLILSRYAFFSAAFPLIYYAAISLRKHRGTAIRNLLLAGLCVLPTLIWYISHWSRITEKLTFFGDPNNYPVQIYGLPTMWELENWLYFAKASVQIQGIGIIPMTLFIISMMTGYFTKIRYGWYLGLSIVCNFFVQTIWLDKIPKYVEYSYPLILILLSGWMLSRKGIKKTIMLILVVTSLLGNFIISLYTFPSATPVLNLATDTYLLPGVKYEYTIGKWPVKEIVNAIQPVPDRPTRVLVLTDHHILNNGTLAYYSWLFGKNTHVFGATSIYDPIRPITVGESELNPFDYIITKTEGDMGVFVNYDATYQINEYLKRSENYELNQTYPLPDESEVLIYRRIKEEDVF